MAKLYEYQGMELLAKGGIPTPKGGRANKKEEVKKIAEEIGKPAVIKAQAWVTGRAHPLKGWWSEICRELTGGKKDNRGDPWDGYQRI